MKKAKERTKTQIIKKERGITLIALVVTIVVLLILAGITISLLFSENGIIAKAKESAEKTNEAIIKEQEQLNGVVKDIEAIVGGKESEVEIVVSKTPETEKSGGVKLVVEEVKGLEGDIDLNSINIANLSEPAKKDMIKILIVNAANLIRRKL